MACGPTCGICACFRRLYDCIVAMVAFGNIAAFVAMATAVFSTSWTRLTVDNLPAISELNGIFWYGLFEVEAGFKDSDTAVLRDDYDDTPGEVNTTRVMMILSLVFQVLFFLALLPHGCACGFCSDCCLNKCGETLAILAGLCSVVFGIVGLIIWAVLINNDADKLLRSVFPDLIPANATSSEDIYGWGYWVALSSVVVEFVITLFIACSCCLCWAAPRKAPEQQPQQVQVPPKQEMTAQPEPVPVVEPEVQSEDPTPKEVQIEDDFQEVDVEDPPQE